MDKLNNINSFTEILIDRFVKRGNVCLDATMGNGNDTLKLAKAVGDTGFVYAFDIQYEALANTKSLLEQNGLVQNVQLIHDSHEELFAYIKENIDFAIYNLGYLPKGDKSITTKAKTTLISLRNVLDKLNSGGIVIVAVYLTHIGAKEEHDEVLSFLETLEQRKYNVFKFEFINQRNNPPVVYGVEFRGGE